MVTRAGQGPRTKGDYRSYLLRLWRAGDQGKPTWRATLRSTQTGRTLAFASLEELFEYLRAETETDADSRHL